MVIPAMVRVPAVPLASAQDAPAKVTVTTWLVVDPVAVQPEKPLGRVIVGVAGTVKLAGNVTAMVLPAASLPLAEVVKPAVQVAVEFAVCGEPEKETLVGVVAVMVTPEAGLAATVSFEVATLNPAAGYEPAAGLVIPAMVNVAAWLLASAQDPPAKVTVTTLLVVVAVAVQLENPLGRVIVGDAGTAKPAGKVAVIVPPEANAPVDEVVKPSVQVAVEFAVCGTPAKVTFVGEVAAAETTRD